MDDFKAKLNSYGPGGIKCRCCRPTSHGGHKDKSWTRHARRVIKQQINNEIKRERDNGV